MAISDINGTHILVFPFPAQGHMLPLLDLTHQLSFYGLTITILVTPKNLPLINPLLSTNPSINPLILPFPSHDPCLIPPGIENVKDLTEKSFPAMVKTMGRLYKPLAQWFESQESPPAAIISDWFLGWTEKLAVRFGIKRVVFSPSGAMDLCVVYSLWKEMPKSEESFCFDRIPNCPKYPLWKFSSLYQSYIEGDPVSEFVKDCFLCDIASWGVVVNTFSELEETYLEFLRRELGHNRVWAVGPLITDKSERGGSSSVAVDDILSWLDMHRDRSVVYVSFGSQTVLTNDQMAAVASGLETNGVRFIWSVKEPTKGHVDGKYGMVPQGFEDRVAGRGLVVRKWAPQVTILNHRAVGAFLTHCGWNSTLEGIVAGVKLLTWPMRADQFVNANLIVDKAKIGVEVCEGATTVPNAAKLGKVLEEAVSEVEGDQLPPWQMIGEAALGAVKEGGSSFKSMNELMDHLTRLRFCDK